MDELSRLVTPKLHQRLRTHIKGFDLASKSRVPASRLLTTALPNVGLIELVSSSSFETIYDEVYRANFHGGERERSDLIVDRLRDDFEGRRTGLAPYRIIGIRDQSGQVAGGAQFSVLFLADGKYVVPYLQYIYVRPENRRQDLSELMHTLILAITMADAEKRGVDKAIVPFTLFETEPPVHGADNEQKAIAAQRTTIHAKSGSVALMLRKKHRDDVISAHVQPGLEVGEPPLTYIWALRANPAVPLELQSDEMGKAIVAAYYQSLRDEGFPKENIEFAERLVEGRYEETSFCLIPLGDVTRAMYVDIDGTKCGAQPSR